MPSPSSYFKPASHIPVTFYSSTPQTKVEPRLCADYYFHLGLLNMASGLCIFAPIGPQHLFNPNCCRKVNNRKDREYPRILTTMAFEAVGLDSLEHSELLGAQICSSCYLKAILNGNPQRKVFFR